MNHPDDYKDKEADTYWAMEGRMVWSTKLNKEVPWVPPDEQQQESV